MRRSGLARYFSILAVREHLCVLSVLYRSAVPYSRIKEVLTGLFYVLDGESKDRSFSVYGIRLFGSGFDSYFKEINLVTSRPDFIGFCERLYEYMEQCFPTVVKEKVINESER